jgi:hypothetical protein
MDFKNKRAITIIRKNLETVNLDLTSLVVLTEVGSDNYIYTPIIPALANAKKVYAVAKDSRYGKADDIVQKCKTILEELELGNVIEFITNDVPDKCISEADIITNSGNLRPLNEAKLALMKAGAVIPLMYEAWEVREQDVDINYCKLHQIKVAGTWEGYNKLPVFNYVGALAVKMAFEAGFEIYGNKVIVWSNDHFGDEVVKAFKENGARVKIVSDFDAMMNDFADTDFIFICDYDEKSPFLGKDGIFDIERMKRVNNSFSIVHLYGDVNLAAADENAIKIYPERNGNAMNMTFTLGHVGLYPILNLQVAGFKVGQVMIENKISELAQPITYA